MELQPLMVGGGAAIRDSRADLVLGRFVGALAQDKQELFCTSGDDESSGPLSLPCRQSGI
jgi:hypothetical protein